MFADAGAEVVKIEPPQGDPMRRWSAGAVPPVRCSATWPPARGRWSVATTTEIAALLAGADLVLTDLTDGWTLDDITARTGPSAVVVAVTPFGTTGPYVDDQVVANEFILQALVRLDRQPRLARRGTAAGGRPDRRMVGGDVRGGGRRALPLGTPHGAAAARSSTCRSTRRWSIAMGGLSAMSASVLGEDSVLTQRSLELPSIVPTADGMVGFCTITAQQFQDFLVLIDRAGSPRRRRAGVDRRAGRAPRRVPRHGHAMDGNPHHGRDHRPRGGVADPGGAHRHTQLRCSKVDHFVQRGVFVESELGVLQPRVPYRSEAIATRPPGRPRIWAPTTAACTGHLGASGPQPADADALPLSDIRVADFTAFWAGPVATQFLGALGADVIKVEGVRRPDGMRFSGGRPPDWDQWWEWGPVFLCSNTNKRGVSVELSTDAGRAIALDLIAASDLVIENFSPRVMENFGLEWDAVSAANPRAVMVRMPAFGLDGPWRDRVGFAQTMEQATGMAWMTGHADGPPMIPRGVCDPIAGLHAAFAAVAALVVRDRDGAGMHVESTMVEAALNVAAEMVVEYSRNGIELRRDGNRGPGASPQGVYRCRGDDEWVALAAHRRRRRGCVGAAHRPTRTRPPTKPAWRRAGRRNRQADRGLDRAAHGGRSGRCAACRGRGGRASRGTRRRC